MSDRKYYVICADGCKFEGMTKEQIITAIMQAASTGEIKDIDGGFITKIIEGNKNAALSFWVGKQAEYNELTEIAENCFYIITDDESDKNFTLSFNEIKDTVNAVEKTTDKLKMTIGETIEAKSVEGVYNNKEVNGNIKNYSLLLVELGGEKVDGQWTCGGTAFLIKRSEDDNNIEFSGFGTASYGSFTDFYHGGISFYYHKPSRQITAISNRLYSADGNEKFPIIAIYGIY